jgi:hypothetical protein
MEKKQLRVGFDLDGVVLYNPLRFARPVIAFVKKMFFKKKDLRFRYPKNFLERWLLITYHKFSLYPASGFEELKKMSLSGKIEPYIITSRYDLFKTDFKKSMEQISADKIFKACFYNQNDEQPHIYKEAMIKKLKLDVFIEDNWNIVQYLNEKCPQTKILWIYNFVDKRIKYQYKFPSLKKAIEFLNQDTL